MKHQGLRKVDFHTDSINLICLLSSNDKGDVSIHHTINDIRELGREFLGCNVTKVHRENVH